MLTECIRERARDLRGVYAITDSSLTPGDRMLEAAEQALRGGISLLQYRDKSRDRQLRIFQARALQKLCAGFDVPLIINDDVELCALTGAAGVHLGQSDSTVGQAREILGADAIIGKTCHSDLDLARQAESEGADYVAFGRFFPSVTKPDAPPASLDILTRARQQLQIPIAAIGGIDATTAPAVLAAGADLLAVINFLFSGENITERVQQLNFLLQQATSTATHSRKK